MSVGAGNFLLVGIFVIIAGIVVGYVFAWDILSIVIIFGFVFLGLGIIVEEFFLWYNTKKEYERDPKASALIGRYHFGIDSKGNRTGKVIMD